jgi:hypothetical protein
MHKDWGAGIVSFCDNKIQCFFVLVLIMSAISIIYIIIIIIGKK